MSKKKKEEQADIDRSDSVRHASEEARQRAKERMRKAMEASQSSGGGDSLETSDEDKAAANANVEYENPDANPDDDLIKEITAKDSDVLSNVKVYSPFKTYFNASANSISAVNLTGPFDVLPGHKPFMTLLTPCEVLIRTSRGEEKLKIERGIMHVRSNQVTVFLDV